MIKYAPNPTSNQLSKPKSELKHYEEELRSIDFREEFEISGRGAKGIRLSFDKHLSSISHYMKVVLEFHDNRANLFLARERIQKALYNTISKVLFAKHFAKRMTQFTKIYKIILFTQVKKKYFTIPVVRAASEPKEFKDDKPDDSSTASLRSGIALLEERVEEIEFFGQQIFKRYDTTIARVKLDMAQIEKSAQDIESQVPIFKEVIRNLNGYSQQLQERISVQDKELEQFKIEGLALKSDFKIQKILLEGRIKEREIADKQLGENFEKLKKLQKKIDEQELAHQKRLFEQDAAYDKAKSMHNKILYDQADALRTQEIAVEAKMNRFLEDHLVKVKLEVKLDTKLYCRELLEENLARRKQELNFAKGNIADFVESNIMRKTVDYSILATELKGELGQLRRARKDIMKLKPIILQTASPKENSPSQIAKNFVKTEQIKSVAKKVFSESEYWDLSLNNSVYSGQREAWKSAVFLSPTRSMPYDERMDQDQWSWQRNINQRINGPKFFESLR
jgi:hypothetical protein